MRRFWITAALGLLVLGGCNKENNVSTKERLCDPGKTEPCFGQHGCSGDHVCREDGQGWELCECRDDGPGGTAGTNASTGGSPGDHAGAPVESGGERSGGGGQPSGGTNVGGQAGVAATGGGPGGEGTLSSGGAPMGGLGGSGAGPIGGSGGEPHAGASGAPAGASGGAVTGGSGSTTSGGSGGVGTSGAAGNPAPSAGAAGAPPGASAGEPCARNADCLDGLVCGINNGPSGSDVCTSDCPEFTLADPREDLCSATCPCGIGQGDCDSTADCATGLECGADNGQPVGLPANWDICVKLCNSQITEFRYQVVDPGSAGGDYSGSCTTAPSWCDGSGLVKDTRTGLLWLRFEYYPGWPPGQTLADAEAYCGGRSMRVPTREEAINITGDANSGCAWPAGWSTWTSTSAGSGLVWMVSEAGSTTAVDVGSHRVVLCVR